MQKLNNANSIFFSLCLPWHTSSLPLKKKKTACLFFSPVSCVFVHKSFGITFLLFDQFKKKSTLEGLINQDLLISSVCDSLYSFSLHTAVN